ncbi:MAG: DUF2066 domain-containing protein [Rhodospirillales bacterium]|nr:DUF2066 domain-containing protein [Rhodospirillales bacterium]
MPAESRFPRQWRKMMAAFAVFVFAAMGAGAAYAQVPASAPSASAAFTVRGIDVDKTAATASTARESAIADGQRRALRRLFERLVPKTAYARLPSPPDAQIADLVESFEVQDERTSSVRYLAKLTYRFKPADIRALLRRSDIPFAESYAKPLVVLPMLNAGGVALLWDEPNPWRAAWDKLPAPDGLAPLIVPLGDLADIADISAEQALVGEEARVAAISNRYGAVGVLVVQATLETPADAPAVLQVALSRFGAVSGDLTVVESYAARPDETDDALMARAAAEIAMLIEERWKDDVLLRFASEASLVAEVKLRNLADWVAVRSRLGEIAIVRRSELVSLMHGLATVHLSYIGDETALRLALAQKDLTLSQDGAAWRLTLTRAAEGAKPATRP